MTGWEEIFWGTGAQGQNGIEGHQGASRGIERRRAAVFPSTCLPVCPPARRTAE